MLQFRNTAVGKHYAADDAWGNSIAAVCRHRRHDRDINRCQQQFPLTECEIGESRRLILDRLLVRKRSGGADQPVGKTALTAERERTAELKQFVGAAKPREGDKIRIAGTAKRIGHIY